MSKPQTMHARDAIAASMAECYFIINGERINGMNAIELKAEFEKNKTEVAILGRVSKGNKAVGGTGTGSCKLHYNSSRFRQMLMDYAATGVDVYFDIQVTNEDPTSTVGRQTVILKDCNLDGGIVALFNADEEILEDEFDFTFESMLMPEKFNELQGAQ